MNIFPILTTLDDLKRMLDASKSVEDFRPDLSDILLKIRCAMAEILAKECSGSDSFTLEVIYSQSDHLQKQLELQSNPFFEIELYCLLNHVHSLSLIKKVQALVPALMAANHSSELVDSVSLCKNELKSFLLRVPAFAELEKSPATHTKYIYADLFDISFTVDIIKKSQGPLFSSLRNLFEDVNLIRNENFVSTGIHQKIQDLIASNMDLYARLLFISFEVGKRTLCSESNNSPFTCRLLHALSVYSVEESFGSFPYNFDSFPIFPFVIESIKSLLQSDSKVKILQKSHFTMGYSEECQKLFSKDFLEVCDAVDLRTQAFACMGTSSPFFENPSYASFPLIIGNCYSAATIEYYHYPGNFQTFLIFYFDFMLKNVYSITPTHSMVDLSEFKKELIAGTVIIKQEILKASFILACPESNARFVDLFNHFPSDGNLGYLDLLVWEQKYSFLIHSLAHFYNPLSYSYLVSLSDHFTKLWRLISTMHNIRIPLGINFELDPNPQNLLEVDSILTYQVFGFIMTGDALKQNAGTLLSSFIDNWKGRKSSPVEGSLRYINLAPIFASMSKSHSSENRSFAKKKIKKSINEKSLDQMYGSFKHKEAFLTSFMAIKEQKNILCMALKDDSVQFVLDAANVVTLLTLLNEDSTQAASKVSFYDLSRLFNEIPFVQHLMSFAHNLFVADLSWTDEFGSAVTDESLIFSVFNSHQSISIYFAEKLRSFFLSKPCIRMHKVDIYYSAENIFPKRVNSSYNHNLMESSNISSYLESTLAAWNPQCAEKDNKLQMVAYFHSLFLMSRNIVMSIEANSTSISSFVLNTLISLSAELFHPSHEISSLFQFDNEKYGIYGKLLRRSFSILSACYNKYQFSPDELKQISSSAQRFAFDRLSADRSINEIYLPFPHFYIFGVILHDSMPLTIENIEILPFVQDEDHVDDYVFSFYDLDISASIALAELPKRLPAEIEKFAQYLIATRTLIKDIRGYSFSKRMGLNLHLFFNEIMDLFTRIKISLLVQSDLTPFLEIISIIDSDRVPSAFELSKVSKALISVQGEISAFLLENYIICGYQILNLGNILKMETISHKLHPSSFSSKLFYSQTGDLTNSLFLTWPGYDQARPVYKFLKPITEKNINSIHASFNRVSLRRFNFDCSFEEICSPSFQLMSNELLKIQISPDYSVKIINTRALEVFKKFLLLPLNDAELLHVEWDDVFALLSGFNLCSIVGLNDSPFFVASWRTAQNTRVSVATVKTEFIKFPWIKVLYGLLRIGINTKELASLRVRMMENNSLKGLPFELKPKMLSLNAFYLTLSSEEKDSSELTEGSVAIPKPKGPQPRKRIALKVKENKPSIEDLSDVSESLTNLEGPQLRKANVSKVKESIADSPEDGFDSIEKLKGPQPSKKIVKESEPSIANSSGIKVSISKPKGPQPRKSIVSKEKSKSPSISPVTPAPSALPKMKTNQSNSKIKQAKAKINQTKNTSKQTITAPHPSPAAQISSQKTQQSSEPKSKRAKKAKEIKSNEAAPIETENVVIVDEPEKLIYDVDYFFDTFQAPFTSVDYVDFLKTCKAHHQEFPILSELNEVVFGSLKETLTDHLKSIVKTASAIKSYFGPQFDLDGIFVTWQVIKTIYACQFHSIYRGLQKIALFLKNPNMNMLPVFLAEFTEIFGFLKSFVTKLISQIKLAAKKELLPQKLASEINNLSIISKPKKAEELSEMLASPEKISKAVLSKVTIQSDNIICLCPNIYFLSYLSSMLPSSLTILSSLELLFSSHRPYLLYVNQIADEYSLQNSVTSLSLYLSEKIANPAIKLAKQNISKIFTEKLKIPSFVGYQTKQRAVMFSFYLPTYFISTPTTLDYLSEHVSLGTLLPIMETQLNLMVPVTPPSLLWMLGVLHRYLGVLRFIMSSRLNDVYIYNDSILLDIRSFISDIIDHLLKLQLPAGLHSMIEQFIPVMQCHFEDPLKLISFISHLQLINSVVIARSDCSALLKASFAILIEVYSYLQLLFISVLRSFIHLAAVESGSSSGIYNNMKRDQILFKPLKQTNISDIAIQRIPDHEINVFFSPKGGVLAVLESNPAPDAINIAMKRSLITEFISKDHTVQTIELEDDSENIFIYSLNGFEYEIAPSSIWTLNRIYEFIENPNASYQVSYYQAEKAFKSFVTCSSFLHKILFGNAYFKFSVMPQYKAEILVRILETVFQFTQKSTLSLHKIIDSVESDDENAEISNMVEITHLYGMPEKAMKKSEIVISAEKSDPIPVTSSAESDKKKKRKKKKKSNTSSRAVALWKKVNIALPPKRAEIEKICSDLANSNEIPCFSSLLHERFVLIAKSSKTSIYDAVIKTISKNRILNSTRVDVFKDEERSLFSIYDSIMSQSSIEDSEFALIMDILTLYRTIVKRFEFFKQASPQDPTVKSKLMSFLIDTYHGLYKHRANLLILDEIGSKNSYDMDLYSFSNYSKLLQERNNALSCTVLIVNSNAGLLSLFTMIKNNVEVAMKTDWNLDLQSIERLAWKKFALSSPTYPTCLGVSIYNMGFDAVNIQQKARKFLQIASKPDRSNLVPVYEPLFSDFKDEALIGFDTVEFIKFPSLMAANIEASRTGSMSFLANHYSTAITSSLKCFHLALHKLIVLFASYLNELKASNYSSYPLAYFVEDLKFIQGKVSIFIQNWIIHHAQQFQSMEPASVILSPAFQNSFEASFQAQGYILLLISSLPGSKETEALSSAFSLYFDIQNLKIEFSMGKRITACPERIKADLLATQLFKIIDKSSCPTSVISLSAKKLQTSRNQESLSLTAFQDISLASSFMTTLKKGKGNVVQSSSIHSWFESNAAQFPACLKFDTMFVPFEASQLNSLCLLNKALSTPTIVTFSDVLAILKMLPGYAESYFAFSSNVFITVSNSGETFCFSFPKRVSFDAYTVSAFELEHLAQILRSFGFNLQ